ncbi:hypothetical protein T36_1074 [Helicobacter cinaedi]|nr:hypothetical protein T36_1074 [Helicobacter cinaedi]BDB66731.1 hypothetical protein Hc94105_0932 [Helicobacter cinaedi]
MVNLKTCKLESLAKLKLKSIIPKLNQSLASLL